MGEFLIATSDLSRIQLLDFAKKEEKEKENGHKMGPCTKSFGEGLSELLALPLSVCPP